MFALELDRCFMSLHCEFKQFKQFKENIGSFFFVEF